MRPQRYIDQRDPLERRAVGGARSTKLRRVAGVARWLLTVLLVASCGVGCQSATQQQADRERELQRNHNEDVVDALADNLPDLLEKLARQEASQVTIDYVLASPGEVFEDNTLHRLSVVRELYSRRDSKPAWVDSSGGEVRLSADGQKLRAILEAGTTSHGLWRDELHLDAIARVELPQQVADAQRVFSDVQLDAEQREAVLAWLSSRTSKYDPSGDMVDLTAAVTAEDGPLAGLGGRVRARGQRLHNVALLVARVDVLMSDALVHYAKRMRFENPAWLRGQTWPPALQDPEKEKDQKAKKDEKAKKKESEEKEKAESGPRLTGKQLQAARQRHLLFETLRPVFADPALVDESLGSVVPPYEPYRRLTAAFEKYSEIVDQGGWPVIPDAAEGLKRGARSEHIPVVKERLRVEGYWDGDDSDKFGSDLRRALLTYQATHQLWENGWLTGQTMESLNVSATERWHQIRLSLQRWRETRVGPDNHYVHVNLPDFHASVWRDGERKMYFKLVIGQTARERTESGEVIWKHATPRFSDTIEYIVFNPYWNVPENIRKKELEPKFEEEPSHFIEKGYEYHTDKNGHRFLRQKPGPENALGQVKFLFPNRYSVYMHDTPKKHLFKHPFRAYSHGCMRMQNPMDFAHYLLDVDGRWKDERREEKLEEWFAKEGETWINLRVELPVHIEYFVVRVDDDGHTNFLADLYRLDRPRLAVIAEKYEASSNPKGVRSVEQSADQSSETASNRDAEQPAAP